MFRSRGAFGVPEICRFLGIVIAMYYRDHSPPHFHVRYAGHRASISLNPLAVLEGSLPPRALGLVMEWATLHGRELHEDWERASRQQPLVPIAPLE
jgi:hypothetical protein